MESMDPAARVERIIAPALDDMGYEIVRVRLLGDRDRRHLQVMVERSDQVGMNVDDCASMSSAVSALLDVEDPIAGPYELEVSSPGIDRPLTRLRDFERFAGFRARVEMREPIDGQRKFRGQVIGVANDCVKLELDQGVAELPFDGIESAKLLMTDELLAAAQSGQHSH